MPWGEHHKGNGPWGKPPSQGGSGGNQPPDIEALLKKASEQFGNFSGGKRPGMGSFLLIGFVLLVIWLSSGFFVVEPEEQGVVLRFGAYNRIADSGLNYHLPYPLESVEIVPVTRINRVEIGGSNGRPILQESLMLTGDENIVDVDFEVQWLVKKAPDFLFNLREQAETVKAVAESAMREVIGRNPITDSLTERRYEIAQEARGIMQIVLDQYQSGIEIKDVPLRDSQPPGQVIDAFRDVQTARADQERARNEAETYRNDIIPRARGEAEKIIQEAEAYKQETIARAQGEAERFLKVYEEYRKAKDVTRKRMYLETLETIYSDIEKILLDSEKGGAGVVPYLPLPELSKSRRNIQAGGN
ncbi:MAG: FtsH protease activity modulator HflK [Rickettsiales bacterium]|nr:FtsH protease activity modulator HflK [Rickettsiales bacterium]